MTESPTSTPAPPSTPSPIELLNLVGVSLPLITGALYLLGRTYAVEYFAVFGLTPRQAGYGAEDLLSGGYALFLAILLAASLAAGWWLTNRLQVGQPQDQPGWRFIVETVVSLALYALGILLITLGLGFGWGAGLVVGLLDLLCLWVGSGRMRIAAAVVVFVVLASLTVLLPERGRQDATASLEAHGITSVVPSLAMAISGVQPVSAPLVLHGSSTFGENSPRLPKVVRLLGHPDGRLVVLDLEDCEIVNVPDTGLSWTFARKGDLPPDCGSVELVTPYRLP